MADYKRLWRVIGNNVRTLEENAPEGYKPVALFTIAGHSSPIPVSMVRSSSAHEWVMLEAHDGGDPKDPKALAPGDRFLLLPDHNVLSVELRFVRSDKAPPGFAYRHDVDADLSDE